MVGRANMFDVLFRNLLFAPSSFDSYAGDTFPGLTDLMYGIERLGDVEAAAQWEKVKQHLATVIFCVNSATFGLKPVEGFQWFVGFVHGEENNIFQW